MGWTHSFKPVVCERFDAPFLPHQLLLPSTARRAKVLNELPWLEVVVLEYGALFAFPAAYLFLIAALWI